MKRSKARTSRKKKPAELPKTLAPLFWDCDFSTLRWRAHRDFIIGRVLAHGDWTRIQNLRLKFSDAILRKWFVDTQGRDLTPPQIHFWQLILRLPKSRVNAWLRSSARQSWDRRNSA